MKAGEQQAPGLHDAARRAPRILDRLAAAYPDAHCTLDHQDPLQLLVATILSAQCTDERVNMVTPALFKRYKTAAAYADADLAELEGLVKATGFFHQKAKSIQGACQAIAEQHGGHVPRTMAALVPLPGVGRKTANVILANAFGVPGMPIDTHCKRLQERLALSAETDPEKIERELCKLLPPECWSDFSHLLIAHGRAICAARKPQCGACVVRDLCPYPDRVAAATAPPLAGKPRTTRRK